jgi:hypothetical protein
MSNNQRNYEKVSGGSNNKRWQPHKEQGVVYSETNPATKEGYYLTKTELTARNPTTGKDDPFNVHEVQEVNPDGSLGECWDVTLGIGLDNTLKNIPLGTFICIKFKGKAVNPKTNRTYNATDVFQDKGAIPYNQLVPKETAAPASNATAAVNAGNKNPVNSNPFPEGNVDDDDQLPF